MIPKTGLDHPLTTAPSQPSLDALANKMSPTGKFFRKRPAICLLLPLMGLGATLLGSCSDSRVSSPPPPPPVAQTPEVLRNNNRPLSPTDSDTNFVVVVAEKVKPAVVQINTSRTVASRAPETFDNPLFRRFFGEAPPPAERTEQGLGSGFVINRNGQILTNAHVVNNADTVTVTFLDGRSLEGKVLGQDPVTDIAVVQVPAKNLSAVEMGNSTQLQPGQWAIAIGSPLGLAETVTVGVVSATERSSSDAGISDKRLGFIQTDAAINPGNSGGPLLDAQGRVIGVNTAIIKGAQGLGFAIPINEAQRIAQQLITQGKVDHPYIGVRMVPLTPQLKQQLNNAPNSDIRVEADRGILVVQVVSNSPAARAGLRPGDVIQTVNNQPANEADELQQLIEKNGIGKPLQVKIQRGNQTLELAVRPEALPSTQANR